MEINNELINELEGLAKIRLSEAEKQKVKDELAEMLGHMEILNELDVSDVEPLTHTKNIQCELRDDVSFLSLSADEILSNAPERDGDFFAVPKAFE